MTSPPCQNDTSCPGVFVCYTSVTSWDAHGAARPDLPIGCYCSNWYGSSNPELDCNGYDTPVAKYWMSICFLNACSAYLLSICSTIDICRLLNTTRKNTGNSMSNVLFRKCDVQMTCLLQLAIGNLILGIGDTLFGVQPLYPLSMSDFHGDKSSTLQIVSYVAILIGITIQVLSCVSIAVLWLEVGNSTKQLRTRTTQTLSKFRTPMIIFEIIFALVMIITFFAAPSTYYLPYVAVFFEIVVLVSYLAGYFSLSRVLMEASAVEMAYNNGPSSPTGTTMGGGGGGGSTTSQATGDSNKKEKPFLVILRDMQRTAVLVVTFLIGTLIDSVVNSVLAVNWRDTTGPPGGPVPASIGCARSITTFVICIGWVVFSFTHRSVNRRIKRTEVTSSDHTHSFQGGGGNHNNKHGGGGSNNVRQVSVGDGGSSSYNNNNNGGIVNGSGKQLGVVAMVESEHG
jgi:hypothetical protein